MQKTYEAALPRFSKSSSPKNSGGVFFEVVLLALILCILALIIFVKSKTATELQYEPLLFAYTIFVTLFQLSRVVAATFYRTVHAHIVPRDTGDYTPSVSFVVPCKNEEKTIAKTIIKSFEADYPKDKLEVIVINDGSTDGTIDVLRSLQLTYPRLIIVDWKENRGKRHGMAEGFQRATGEIIVQLDSDSYIEPHTFRHLVAPFKNPEVGAVCAHADPENADDNFLTKMQAAYYFVSFRILKAAESAFATVFCCSGCSSAYRRDIVMPILDEWLKEKFLGLPVTWGDDRALTNRVLKAGYRTIYTDDVQAFTIVPTKFKTFIRQQVRWKKGWFVNSIFASRFIYKQDPFVTFTYFFPLIFVTLITPFMATRALVYGPLVLGINPFFYIFGVFLVASVITIYYRYLQRHNKYWPYVFAWSAINMVVLSFILFYALATIQNRKWGTR